MSIRKFPVHADWPKFADTVSLPDPYEILRSQMRKTLEDGTLWKAGTPTDAEKMAILFFAGVPMKFEDHGIEGMRVVTAVKAGLVYDHGQYLVATENDNPVAKRRGEVLRFTRIAAEISDLPKPGPYSGA